MDRIIVIMERIYKEVITEHLASYRQMIFLMGPRQVGKTTLSRDAAKDGARSVYFNWDNPAERLLFLEGPDSIAAQADLDVLHESPPILIFDEIHKFNKWKIFLKGFFDKYEKKARIIVTGSARLDVYQKGGDSLMGRYFYYRVHPISVAEIAFYQAPEKGVRQAPKKIAEDHWQALLQFGGFPEPFLQRSTSFSKRWQRIRKNQLFQEDIRDATRIQEIAQLEILAEMIQNQAASAVELHSLATKVRVSVDTIRRWIETLRSFYFCFTLQPWSKNVTRSLIKEPKIYLWDWSLVQDEGQRNENFVASHLLKAVHFWTDRGLGNFALHYIRTKDKKEIDFVVTKDNEPWFLVEVKSKKNGISKELYHFHDELKTKHAFQVTVDMPFIDRDCFSHHNPVIVPAKTFLSQLV
jgi:uncharacterized protein